MEFYGEQPSFDLTYSDVFLVPSQSSVTSRLDVSLAPNDGTGMTIPIVSANMNSVTGPRLAATLARRGGLGVLPQDMNLQELDTAIRWVKDQSVNFDTPLILPPEATVASALSLVPPLAAQGIVIRDTAGSYLGCIAASELGLSPLDTPLGDLLHGSIAALDADDIGSARHAFDVMAAADIDFAPVLHHGVIVGTLSHCSAARSCSGVTGIFE